MMTYNTCFELFPFFHLTLDIVEGLSNNLEHNEKGFY